MDWAGMQKQKDTAVAGLTKGIEGLFKKNKVCCCACSVCMCMCTCMWACRARGNAQQNQNKACSSLPACSSTCCAIMRHVRLQM